MQNLTVGRHTGFVEASSAMTGYGLFLTKDTSFLLPNTGVIFQTLTVKFMDDAFGHMTHRFEQRALEASFSSGSEAACCKRVELATL